MKNDWTRGFTFDQHLIEKPTWFMSITTKNNSKNSVFQSKYKLHIERLEFLIKNTKVFDCNIRFFENM